MADCNGPCTYPNQYAGQGSFKFRRIQAVWGAQEHIRQYGSVVTRFDVYSGEQHELQNTGRDTLPDQQVSVIGITLEVMWGSKSCVITL